MNVLEVNLELISDYPDVYQEFVKTNNTNGVREMEFILVGFISFLAISAGVLTYSLVKAER